MTTMNASNTPSPFVNLDPDDLLDHGSMLAGKRQLYGSSVYADILSQNDGESVAVLFQTVSRP